MVLRVRIFVIITWTSFNWNDKVSKTQLLDSYGATYNI
jgi:hypothetical protein